ncbi:Tad domain-containing protein [Sphingomonas turrisvirgatae]|uniref:Putative Flp pilus-assembly TadG-like N-terminal domain-containing protein n=1 Tax=Sphingomonas turrisvirgatae TaxID=1888892 RepID=A0A1E3LYD6_9SPHN|nr:TadE/TadG family type IV pilus assembly protein [Sphingomonas turrisvirgatae]ODP38724.1 hypothetical protein BFL28_00160 [Sphingomonas turrisvirgatae]
MSKRESTWAAAGWLARLGSDVRANTAAIVAISLIPLAGMVGGGVDISRMYIVKTRLQHACDAGALAGRKQMGGGIWSYNNYEARAAAEKFFDANIQQSPYGASDVTKSFTENAGKVSGVASATLPMTIMRIFGRSNETLSVTCDAEMRLPNTDVMFVLDTTGSMDGKAVSTDPDTKIQALRTAVKCFYEIVARLDTSATCTGGAPSGGTGDQVQIRFGFVPYATNVNVGRLLPTSYFPDAWDYQTRRARWNVSSGSTTTFGPTVSTPGPTGSGNSEWSSPTQVSQHLFACPSLTNQNDVPGNFVIDTTPTIANGIRTWETRTYTRVNIMQSCTGNVLVRNLMSQIQGTGTYTTVVYTQTVTTAQNRTFAGWDYDKWSINISGLKNGTEWRDSFVVPEMADNGADLTVAWNGCIEERQTVSGTNFNPIPAGAKDLDIDSVPVPGDVSTMWKPALAPIIYHRRTGTGNTYTLNRVTVGTAPSFTIPRADATCPSAGRKLQSWPSASAFDDYVDGLITGGNTYHDIGLLWGARLMSPTGIFRAENQFTPKGAEIERHLIFMTDGDTQTSTANYAAYGQPWYDRRNISSVGASPGDVGMNDEVNARFTALCTAIKNKNITLWVISFGSGSNTTTETRLQNCASSGRYFVARDSATLQSTFRSIADQISQLRLTR